MTEQLRTKSGKQFQLPDLAMFEHHQAQVEPEVNQIRESRNSVRKQLTVTTAYCGESGKTLVDVFLTSIGAVVVTYKYKNRVKTVGAVAPLTSNPGQEFPLAQVEGLQFKPITAGRLIDRITQEQKRFPLKDRRKYDALGNRINPSAKERRDEVSRSLSSLVHSDDEFPARDELIAYTKQELARAEERLTEERRQRGDR